MINKPVDRAMSTKTMDMQSLASMSSVHTVDRERLRDKARRMQMNEKARFDMCVRLQQTMHQTPKRAHEMASEVLRILKQRKLLPANLTDAALAEIVTNLTSRRQEQISLAASTTTKPVPCSDDHADSARPMKLRLSQEGDSGRQSSGGTPHFDTKSVRGKNGRGGGTSGQSSAEDERYVTETQQQQKSVGFSLPDRVASKNNHDCGIWEKIIKFSSFEEKKEAQLLKERKLRERREYTSKLEDQVLHKRQSTQQARELSAEFHRQTLENIRQAEDEERRKEQTRLSREHQLIASQTQQRVAKQVQQERARAVKKAHELHAAELLEKQKNDELAREKARKEAEKRRVEQVLQENETQLQQKRQHHAQERELEVKLAEEYIAMEKKKDEARRRQILSMADNIKKKMKIFNETAKVSTDSKAREEDERAQRYQQEYTKKQVEDEHKRRADAEVRSRAQAEYLRVQMHEKKEREKALKLDLNKQADLWKQERFEAEERDKVVKQQRALRNRSQQNILLEQIRERESRRFQPDQSHLEVQLNARLLEMIHKQAGEAQNRAEDVVFETQNRSRELQEEEHNRHSH